MVAELHELVFQLFEAVALFDVVIERLFAGQRHQCPVDGVELFPNGRAVGALAGGLDCAAGDSEP